MSKMKRVSLTIFLTFLLLGFTAVVNAAEGCGQAQGDIIADEMIGAGGISWMPKISYARLVLSVARPDGTIFNKTFEGSVNPYLDLAGLFRDNAIDGTYSYELRAIPLIAKKTRLEGVRLTDSPRKAMTQTGNFLVRGGAIVTPGAPEKLDRTSDALHYDDVIITGSLCVGFDCINGESFGYCTMKLKENNLQLCFEDTSIGSFPTNDWKIQINDTTSGGASYFTIWDTDGGRRPFTLEAGAPAHSLYVEDYGRVGLGTSIPYVELHIVDGDSPTIRLDQDGSSGWVAQRWDLCGNETNFFVRDVTNGSKLCFRIQPNTPSNTLCMRSTGYVGIGTWSPEATLHVEETGPAKLILKNTSAAKWAFNSDNFSNLRMNANDSATIAFELEPDGDLTIAGALTTAADTYPDYVFEPDYNLMPINKLAEFVKQEKHLPRIPKAEEMKKNGINMSELQMRLLEKVEEMTLYLVSQQETIDELKKEITELKKK